jgi:hypothetical protein
MVGASKVFSGKEEEGEGKEEITAGFRKICRQWIVVTIRLEKYRTSKTNPL